MKSLNPLGLSWDEYVVVHLRTIIAVVAILVALLVGWRQFASSRATVLTGKVSSRGQAVVFGTVTVLDGKNRPHTVPLAADGTYTVRDLPPGPVRLAVSSPNPVPVTERSTAAAQAPAPEKSARDGSPGGGQARKPGSMPPKADAARPAEGISIAAPDRAATAKPPTGPDRSAASQAATGWFRIPGRYANPATSGLKTDVRSGPNTLDLTLEE